MTTRGIGSASRAIAWRCLLLVQRLLDLPFVVLFGTLEWLGRTVVAPILDLPSLVLDEVAARRACRDARLQARIAIAEFTAFEDEVQARFTMRVERVRQVTRERDRLETHLAQVHPRFRESLELELASFHAALHDLAAIATTPMPVRQDDPPIRASSPPLH